MADEETERRLRLEELARQHFPRPEMDPTAIDPFSAPMVYGTKESRARALNTLASRALSERGTRRVGPDEDLRGIDTQSDTVTEPEILERLPEREDVRVSILQALEERYAPDAGQPAPKPRPRPKMSRSAYMKAMQDNMAKVDTLVADDTSPLPSVKSPPVDDRPFQYSSPFGEDVGQPSVVGGKRKETKK